MRKKITIVAISLVVALLGCICADYTFGTLLKHNSYRELSTTTLISAGWLHGIAALIFAAIEYKKCLDT
jgi:hypothetical protein